MTWLLGKLGLSLASGKTLLPIAAVLAAAAGLVSVGLYTVHHFTAAGFDKAVRECAAKDAAHNAYVADEGTRLREAGREVIIKHTTAIAVVKAAAANERREVKDDTQANPAPTGCGLTPVGLRIWNRPLGEVGIPALPGGSIPADASRFGTASAASGEGGRSGFATGQPDGFKGSLRDLTQNRPRLIGPGEALPAAAASAKRP